MSSFNILYPNISTVSETKIRSWFFDAVANGEFRYDNDKRIEQKADEAKKKNDVHLMALALHDVGLITLSLATSSEIQSIISFDVPQYPEN